MDFLPHLRREIQEFETAARQVTDAPPVPSCPGWSMADLVMHLGGVHRGIVRLIVDKRQGFPDMSDLAFLKLPGDLSGWPDPARAPNLGPMPPGLCDWFAEGAAELAEVFAGRAADEPAWTWSAEQSVGFWLRMQTIEAAGHRWDAQLALGRPEPIDRELAADAVAQTFEVMVPARRAWTQAPPGAGESYLFRQSDGDGVWPVRFDGAAITREAGDHAVEVSGTASDLMLFLWHRIGADTLRITGERSLLDRYFVLVPPV